MKRLMSALLATSALAFAIPAAAHEHPPSPYGVEADDDYDGWDLDVGTYEQFNQEYQHIWNGIRHGVSDGSYSPRQAQQFFRQMQQIRARADWMQRSGYYDPEDIEERLERLHDRMHLAHERGHERQDRYDRYGYDRR